MTLIARFLQYLFWLASWYYNAVWWFSIPLHSLTLSACLSCYNSFGHTNGLETLIDLRLEKVPLLCSKTSSHGFLSVFCFGLFSWGVGRGVKHKWKHREIMISSSIYRAVISMTKNIFAFMLFFYYQNNKDTVGQIINIYSLWKITPAFSLFPRVPWLYM